MWKMQLAHMMKENGMHIRGYVNSCFVCDVHRDGRSDDDIDTIMRTMKIITTMVFFFAYGVWDNLQFKYRIVED